MKKTRQQRALETRERILDCAIEVFYERGVARPSLTDIAKLASVTRGAVYGHFANKVDLFSALCDRVRLPAEAIGAIDPDSCDNDPLGKLRSLWLYLLSRVASDPQWRKILDIIMHRCELVPESGQIKQRLHLGHCEAIARETELLRRAVALKQLPADLDVEAAVPLMHAALVGVLNTWLLFPDTFDLAEQSERYVDALLHMLRTAPSLRQAAPSAAQADDAVDPA